MKFVMNRWQNKNNKQNENVVGVKRVTGPQRLINKQANLLLVLLLSTEESTNKERKELVVSHTMVVRVVYGVAFLSVSCACFILLHLLLSPVFYFAF
jgi:hypothetical protein